MITGKENYMRMQARLHGQSYVNSLGEKVGEKKAIIVSSLCGKAKCRFNCSTKIDAEARTKILSEYYLLQLMLKMHIYFPVSSVQRREQQLQVQIDTKKFQSSTQFVCKIVLSLFVRKLRLYGISLAKVDHLVMQARAGQTTVRPSLRGKHVLRPNKTSQQSIDLVQEHVRLYPAERSHYSRNQNPNRLYLSPMLTICEMYRQYESWAADRKVVPVSAATYRSIFCSNFNLEFECPRSDTCSKCETAGINPLMTLLDIRH